MLGGIHAVGEEPSRFLAAGARPLEAHRRIDTECQALLLASEAVLQTPVPSNGGRDFQIQAAAIEKEIFLKGGFGVDDHLV